MYIIIDKETWGLTTGDDLSLFTYTDGDFDMVWSGPRSESHFMLEFMENKDSVAGWNIRKTLAESVWDAIKRNTLATSAANRTLLPKWLCQKVHDYTPTVQVFEFSRLVTQGLCLDCQPPLAVEAFEGVPDDDMLVTVLDAALTYGVGK